MAEIVKIQSTAASNMIEGIIAISTHMKQLFMEKATPRNRDESEIIGYLDVLNIIHESNESIPIHPCYILHIYHGLLRYADFFMAATSKTAKTVSER